MIEMILKKPYGFLIKNFKLIHLILTGIYIYLAVKVNNILHYYNGFIAGTASKIDARNYITSYYIIGIILSIIICLIVYALMKYKKKPRILYLILIVFSLITVFIIQYSYVGLNTIYISVLNSKSLLLYRDLLRIMIVSQYIVIAIVLVRGLGFDIKKFNFVQDLQELGIDVTDDEEVEFSLGGSQHLVRKFNRNLREIKYYYFENKIFILIIIGVILFFGLGTFIFDKEVVNKVYNQNEFVSTDNFQFNVLNSYISNKDYKNNIIMGNDTSFVIVKINLSSKGEKRKFNTSNLILEVDDNSYTCEKRYSTRFSDIGITYKDDKIGNNATYLFVYNVSNEDLEKNMKLVYANDKRVELNPVWLDKSNESDDYRLGEEVNLSNSIFRTGIFKVSFFEINDNFSYPYEYEINGQSYTYQLTISSVRKTIMHLKLENIYPKGIDNLSFFDNYVKIKYKNDDVEYEVKSFDNNTPDGYKDGVYLAVDKDLLEATNIWLEIKIRNKVYKYILK